LLLKGFLNNYAYHLSPGFLFGRIFTKGLIYTFSVLILRLLAHQANLPDFPEKGLLSIMGRPESWRFFVCGLIPLGFCLQSIFIEAFAWWILKKYQNQSMIKAKSLQTLSIDSWSLLALPLLGAIIIFHHNLSQWAILAGMLFFFVLLGKLFLISGILWSLAQEERSTFSEKHFLPKITCGLALMGFISLTCLGFWTNQAVSTAGDEPAYLINSQRVVAALVPGSTPQPKKGKDRFYWGRWSEKLAQPLARSPLFVTALAPVVKIAGRLGAIALNSAAAGACLALFFYLAIQLGYTPRTSLLATGLLFFSAPFFQLSQHIYPGIFGILFTLAGLTLLHKPGPVSKGTVLKLAGVILAISLFKLRFSPVALAMALSAAYLWLPWPAKKAKGFNIILLGHDDWICFHATGSKDISSRSRSHNHPQPHLDARLDPGHVPRSGIWPAGLCPQSCFGINRFGVFLATKPKSRSNKPLSWPCQSDFHCCLALESMGRRVYSSGQIPGAMHPHFAAMELTSSAQDQKPGLADNSHFTLRLDPFYKFGIGLGSPMALSPQNRGEQSFFPNSGSLGILLAWILPIFYKPPSARNSAGHLLGTSHLCLGLFLLSFCPLPTA
jgi:hypothetical protein